MARTQANDMIVQRFEHPSGATAVLEWPQGWSRSSFWRLTTTQADGKEDVHTQQYASPAEARAGAVARQRTALADGWVMSGGAGRQPPRQEVAIYRDSQRIDVGVSDVEVSHVGPGVREASIAVVSDRMPLVVGDRLVVRQRVGTVGVEFAMVVESVQMRSSDMHDLYRYRISGRCDSLAEDDRQAIDREEAIQRAADAVVDGSDLFAYWDLLKDAFPDTSERQAAVNRVVLIRQQRRDEASRLERLAQDAERRRLLEAVAASGAGASQPVGALRPGRHNVPAPAQSRESAEAAIRRLSGGQVPGEKKRRRINLGE